MYRHTMFIDRKMQYHKYDAISPHSYKIQKSGLKEQGGETYPIIARHIIKRAIKALWYLGRNKQNHKTMTKQNRNPRNRPTNF